MVLLLPPAPAALVLDGRALARRSCRSAAAFLLIAVAGPPGAFGDAGRAVVVPALGELTGEEGRGDDWSMRVSPSPDGDMSAIYPLFLKSVS